MYRDDFGLNGYSAKVGGDPFARTGSLATQVLSTHVPMPAPAPLLDRQERGLLMLREAIRVVAGDGGTRGAHAAGSRHGSGARHGGGSGTADRPGGPVAGDGESEAMVHLVRQAQEGSADAFGELYRIYCDTVFRYIYYRVSTRALAEDLTSETFVRALRRITTFSWQGRDFGAWLVTIARNLVADHFKSGSVHLTV